MRLRGDPMTMAQLFTAQRALAAWAHEGREPSLPNAILLVLLTEGQVGLWELMPSRPPPGDLPPTLPLIGTKPPGADSDSAGV